MERYNIDGQKLIYHPGRVAKWLDGADSWEKALSIYPIYVEISPFGGCNHRCTFCALDYMNYKPLALEAGRLSSRLAEMGRLGVKSVMFAGEGEPLLHKEIVDIGRAATQAGVNISFTSNGVLFDRPRMEALLPITSWIKVSLDAGTPSTYAAVHRTKETDFHRVVDNLKAAADFKRANGLTCTLGVQMLLLPENMGEAETLARLCRDVIGVDYLVLKPYSQHLRSIGERYKGVDYSGLEQLKAMAAELSTPETRVIFRASAVSRATMAKGYSSCSATPFFWAYISSSGDVYSCSAFLGDSRFRLGNILEQPFQDIWEGDGRRRNWELVRHGLAIDECRINCRMDAVNLYLWRLAHPQLHDNFI